MLREKESMSTPRHLHRYLELNGHDSIMLHFNSPAYVYLMDDTNYRLYLDEKEYEYYGDLVQKTPFRVRAPGAGRWHLVIEQKNPAHTLSVTVQIVREG
jgi:hypothetical protein